MIHILDAATVNRIAAGEVIDRPKSVVKELCENAVDADATAISVEIKDGGIDLIRVTDNGCGIPKEDIPKAFLRHSTSKISSAEDLLTVKSLGFRGEALSSIAAVAKVSLISKTSDSAMAQFYRIEGGEEMGLESVGAPEGTTVVVKDLFYNTPARRKFLKTARTEASYVIDLIERLALSRPDICFRLQVNGNEKFYALGNGNSKDIVYQIYGREISEELIYIDKEREWMRVSGFLARPVVTRADRSAENYFINGRYIRSDDINIAIEKAYNPYLMKHRFPFTLLYFDIAPELLDVNVHPSKMRLRLRNCDEICGWISETINESINKSNMAPDIVLPANTAYTEKKQAKPIVSYTEPFEENARLRIPKESSFPVKEKKINDKEETLFNFQEQMVFSAKEIASETEGGLSGGTFRLIGQLFETYWLCQYQDKFLLVDQHAAHEKVNYERIMKSFTDGDIHTQYLSPPIILTLTAIEQDRLNDIREDLDDLGFAIEDFGGRDICVRGVPANIYSLEADELLKELLSDDTYISAVGTRKRLFPEIICDRIAAISCKASVKANDRLSYAEAEELIKKMLTLKDAYHCPHGRPTVIEITKREIEKLFKRIV